MTKKDIDRTKKLIQTDLLTMSGGNNSSERMMFGILIFIFLAGGFAVSPIVGVVASVMGASVAVTEMTKNEMKYNCANMYCVLPVSRKELVRSRFVFAGGTALALNIAVYLLMLLSLKVRLYDHLLTDTGEMLHMICEKTGGTMSEFAMMNLLYSGGLALSMSAAAAILKSYFKNGRQLAENMELGYTKNMSRKDRISGTAAIVGCFAVIGMIVYSAFTGKVSLGAAITLVLSLIIQLMQAADGLLLGAVFLTMGAFSFIYTYICTVIDYEDKDI